LLLLQTFLTSRLTSGHYGNRRHLDLAGARPGSVSSNGRTTPTDNDRQFNKQYLLKKYGN
jgi:hypothetical protein